MYRKILVPNRENHSIKLPDKFLGRKVEVIAFEIKEERTMPETDKLKAEKREFLNDIEFIYDFPDIKKIREQGWPGQRK